MAEKVKSAPSKPRNLFPKKSKCTNEVEAINFNDVVINYVDDGQLMINLKTNPDHTIFLTPIDAIKLIEFLQKYVDQFKK